MLSMIDISCCHWYKILDYNTVASCSHVFCCLCLWVTFPTYYLLIHSFWSNFNSSFPPYTKISLLTGHKLSLVKELFVCSWWGDYVGKLIWEDRVHIKTEWWAVQIKCEQLVREIKTKSRKDHLLSLRITILNVILFCLKGSSLSFVNMWSSWNFVTKKKKKRKLWLFLH